MSEMVYLRWPRDCLVVHLGLIYTRMQLEHTDLLRKLFRQTTTKFRTRHIIFKRFNVISLSLSRLATWS